MIHLHYIQSSCKQLNIPTSILVYDPEYIKEWDRRCALAAAAGVPKLQPCPRCGYELPDYFLTLTDISVVCSVCQLEARQRTVECARWVWNEGTREDI